MHVNNQRPIESWRFLGPADQSSRRYYWNHDVRFGLLELETLPNLHNSSTHACFPPVCCYSICIPRHTHGVCIPQDDFTRELFEQEVAYISCLSACTIQRKGACLAMETRLNCLALHQKQKIGHHHIFLYVKLNPGKPTLSTAVISLNQHLPHNYFASRCSSWELLFVKKNFLDREDWMIKCERSRTYEQISKKIYHGEARGFETEG